MVKSEPKIVPFPLYTESYLKPYYLGSKMIETASPIKKQAFPDTKVNQSNEKINLSPEQIIAQLMEVYQILCTACNLINQIFQLQILCFALNSFLGIVFFIYYILIFKSVTFSHELIDCVIPYLWIQVIGCVLDMVAIVCACSYATSSVSWYICLLFVILFPLNDPRSKRLCDEHPVFYLKAEKIAWTVSEMLYKDNLPQGARDQLNRFALQLIHVKPKFTIFGMFNVDGTLLFTIAGASTTYLIILFQFTTKEDNNLSDGLLNGITKTTMAPFLNLTSTVTP